MPSRHKGLLYRPTTLTKRGHVELISSANGMSPAWSPDGERITFLSNRAEGWDLYVAASAGGEPTRLTSGATADHPAWHPDGERIAVERNGRIELVHADGSGRELLLERAGQPAWAGDGRLAFVRGGDLWLLTRDGEEEALLVDAAQPSWSPDGARIAVVRHDGINAFELAGGELRLLTHERGDSDPAWSPKGAAGGERIIFARRAALFEIAVEGGEARPLPQIESPAAAPAFAPPNSGPLLAYDLYAGSNWNVAISNLASGERCLLTQASWISWNARR